MRQWHSRISKFSVLICKTSIQIDKQINKKDTRKILKKRKKKQNHGLKCSALWSCQSSYSSTKSFTIPSPPQSPVSLWSDRTPEESGKAARIYIAALLFFHPWRRKCNPLKYSYLDNPTDRGAWQATVHGVAKSWTQLSNFHLPSPASLFHQQTSPSVFCSFISLASGLLCGQLFSFVGWFAAFRWEQQRVVMGLQSWLLYFGVVPPGR